ncbi:MAG: hypothetical protein K8T26_14120 [Lentisphaerae bacterium]|nr:hypothetical protein [Lentisphaerota bacterium]
MKHVTATVLYGIISGSLCLFCVPRGVAETLRADEYAFKMRIAFDAYTGSPLTNFPALVRFDGSGGFYDGFMSASGYDLRFADAATNRLNHEVERWAAGSNSFVWVQVPMLTNGAAIWAYWGNRAEAAGPAAFMINGATWADGDLGVWHLDHLSGAGKHPDSTIATADGANVNTASTNGPVANGCHFASGAASSVMTPLNIDQGGTVAITFSAWANPAITNTGLHPVMSSDNGGWDWALLHVADKWTLANGSGYWNTGVAVETGAWQHVAAVFIPGTGVRFFKNGIETANATIAYDGSDANVAIGRNPSFLEYFDGAIDEARVSRVARSADWIRASYSNQVAGSTFVALGTPEPLPAARLNVGRYACKRQIAFNTYTGSPLTNFPVLVRFDGSGGFYDEFSSTNGYDLRFADADTYRLNHEVGRWTAGGDSYVWVQVPLLTNGAALWAYWGNPAEAAAPAAFTTNGATWSDGCNVGVWHLDEAVTDESSAGRYRDSMDLNPGIQNNNGTGAGVVGACGDFDGAGDYIRVIDKAYYNNKDYVTASIWVKVVGGWNTSYQTFLSKGFNNFWDLRRRANNDQLSFCLNNGNQSSLVFTPMATDGQWHHLVGAYSQSPLEAKIFLDGNLYHTFTPPALLGDTTGTDLFISGRNFGDLAHRGLLDEVQVARAYRSADWIKAAYSNQVAGSTFATLGPPVPAQGIANRPATVVAAGMATLRALLNASAAGYYAVVYWGQTDGGTNAADWDHERTVGFYVDTTTNLDYTATEGIRDTGANYFTWRVTNETTSAWAQPSASWSESREWRGAVDNAWATPQNWSGDNAPDAADEVARFAGQGSGDIDLVGASYRCREMDVTAGDYTWVDTSADPGALTVGALRITGGAGRFDVGLTVSGVVEVAGGTLALAKTGGFAAERLDLNGGALRLIGDVLPGTDSPVALTNTPVNLVADSSIGATCGTNVAGLGALTMGQGVTLTVPAGSPVGFASTTLPAGVTAAGFNVDAETWLTQSAGLDGSGAAVTMTKTGPGNVMLDKPGSHLGAATFDIQAGGLAGIGADAFGAGALQLNGGELKLSSPGGDLTVANPLATVGSSTLTAGQIATGVAGPLTVTIAGNVDVTAGKTLVARATDDYSLHLSGEVTGAGTLCVATGTVIIDDTDFENLQILGGTAQLNGTPTVGTLTQSAGTLVGVTGALTVLNAIQIGGAVNLSGAGLNAATADLTVNPDGTLTLSDPLSANRVYLHGELDVAGAITTAAELHLWPQANHMRVLTNALQGAANVYIGDPDGNWGYVALTAANTYGGFTQLRSANLRAADGVGLPASSRLVFNAGGPEWPGVWETSGTIARGIGTAAGEVYWQDQGGGFAAVGGDLTIALEGNAPLTWSSGTNGFNNVPALKLGSRWADGKTELTNPLFINRNDANVQIGNNQPEAIDAFDVINDTVRLSGTLAGDRGWNNEQVRFNQATNRESGYGRGLVELTGTNTYPQRTVIHACTVFAESGVGLPADSILLFQSPDWAWTESILLSHGTFARAIGGASEAKGTVSWGWGAGGFAARGGSLTVSFPNAGGLLDWGSTNRGFNSQALQLNSQYADSRVTIATPIGLGGADRAITVFDNPHTDTDVAVLTGALAGTNHAQRLTKTGPGTLWLTGTNTFRQVMAIAWGALRVNKIADQIAPGSTIAFWASERDDNWPRVLEARGMLTKSLSSDWQAADCISFTNGAGGFAAYGGPLTVYLQGGAALRWNDGNGGFSNRPLHVGSRTANNVVHLLNDLDLRGDWRRVYAWDNPQSEADYALLAGNLINSGGFGALQVYGDGTLKLAGDNEPVNIVRVSDFATVLVNGTLRCSESLDTDQARGPDFVTRRHVPGSQPRPTLGGTGTVLTRDMVVRAWSAETYGTLAPGDAGAGTLSVATTGADGLRLNAFATYTWELGAAAADKVAVTGNLTLDSGWRLDLRGAGGAPQAGQQYDLFTYTGTFNGEATPALVTDRMPATWLTNDLMIVHDTVSVPRRIYMTGLGVQQPRGPLLLVR